MPAEDLQVLTPPKDRPIWSSPSFFQYCDLFFPDEPKTTLYLRTQRSPVARTASATGIDYGVPLSGSGPTGIEVGCVGPGEPPLDQLLGDFCGAVLTVVRSLSEHADSTADWETISPRPGVFETHAPERDPFTTNEAKAALNLRERPVREWVWQLSKTKSAKNRKWENAEAPPGVDSNKLEADGIIEKHSVVVCKQTAATLATIGVGDKTNLQSLSCASCGRSFADEDLRLVYVPTQLARSITQHGRWLGALLYGILRSYGLRQEDVLVEFVDGSDEIDFIVNLMGRVLVMELKDKDYDYGKTALFSPRFRQHNATAATLICTGRLDEKAGEFLTSEASQANIKMNLHENVTDLSAALWPGVVQCELAAVHDALSGVMSFVNLDLADLVIDRIAVGGKSI